MRFKLKGTEVKISFTFFAVYLIFICFSKGEIFFYSIAFSLLHELIHIILILFYKGRISCISLTAAGGNIKRDSSVILSNVQEAVISISAPLFNLLLGFVVLLFFQNKTLAYINLILGGFNILPFFSFDGGRFLYFLLQNRLSDKALQLILTFLSLIVAVVFSVLSGYIFINVQKNVLILFLSGFMLFSLIINTFKQFSE